MKREEEQLDNTRATHRLQPDRGPLAVPAETERTRLGHGG
jgi:hypothetical protein